MSAGPTISSANYGGRPLAESNGTGKENSFSDIHAPESTCCHVKVTNLLCEFGNDHEDFCSFLENDQTHDCTILVRKIKMTG